MTNLRPTFHVYDKNNNPVSGLINLEEDDLINKITDHEIDFKEHEVLRVESEEEMTDASY
tara:strand:- start:1013 stop:1192 length:180 start_codon:yes stop_codon:yes gene_type:complete